MYYVNFTSILFFTNFLLCVVIILKEYKEYKILKELREKGVSLTDD